MPPRFLAMAAKIANAILVSAVITLALLSMVLVQRNWISLRHAASSPREVLFWAAPAVLAVLLLAGLRLRAVHRVQFVLAWSSLAFSLYAAEMFLYFVGSGVPTHLLPIDATMSKDARQEARAFANR